MTLSTERPYRNSFEEKLGAQLEQAGIPFDYEGRRVPVVIPAREAKYLPDFIPTGTNIVIEGKGAFGGGRVNYNATSAAARQKMILVKEQNPDLDIRFVFTNSKSKIYTGSKTTYADWCRDHGFKFADKAIPAEWLREIKMMQRKNHVGTRDYDELAPKDFSGAKGPKRGPRRGRSLGAR